MTQPPSVSRVDAAPVGILMYHAVVEASLPVPDWCFLDAGLFRAQMQHLRAAFDVIPLADVPARQRAHDLERPTVAITFDDGFLNNYEVAFPVLRELGLPATIFLTTGFLGGDDTLWYCRVNQALATTKRSSLDWGGEHYDLGDTAARTEAARVLNARLKTFPHRRLLDEVRTIARSLDTDPGEPVDRRSPFRMLGSLEIAEMRRSGLIDFGGHTVSHAILSKLSADEQRHEIETSVAAVARLTGAPCTLFAYPNGRAEDYDRDSVRILERCGVRTAVTVIEDVSDATAPPLELRRLGVGEESDWQDFLARMSAAWGRA